MRREFLKTVGVFLASLLPLRTASAAPEPWLETALRRLRRRRDGVKVEPTGSNGSYHIQFCTARHCYSITVKSGRYLGGYACARQPLSGEDWLRGNDLADGPYCEATWNRIMEDVVAYEITTGLA